jgi:hypothetical protein
LLAFVQSLVLREDMRAARGAGMVEIAIGANRDRLSVAELTGARFTELARE